MSICRTCLSGNYKVYTIRNTTCQEMYLDLTNNELKSEDGRPETVCYLCHAQLERWRRLRAKSQTSEEIWKQLLQNNIPISQESIAILDKRIEKVFITTPVEVTMCLKVDTNHKPLPLIDDFNIDNVKMETVKIEKMCEKTEDSHSETICRSCLCAVNATYSIVNTPLLAIYEKLINTKSCRAPCDRARPGKYYHHAYFGRQAALLCFGLKGMVAGEITGTRGLTSLCLKLTDAMQCRLDSGSGRPAAVCYICRWLLKKCHKFVTKAIKCDKILTELFLNGIQLTENAIEVLNKRMKTSLAVTPIKLFTYIDVTGVKIKIEIESDGDNDAEGNDDNDAKGDDDNDAEEDDDNAAEGDDDNDAERDDDNDAEGDDDNDAKDDKSPKLREVLSNEHPKKSLVKIRLCEECSYSCNTEIQLNKHKRFHDLKRKFCCKKCHYRFDTNNHLRAHHKAVHTPRYKCDKCPKKFPSKRECKMHKITHTSNYFTCEVCAKIFRQRSSLRAHNNINHPNVKHPCGKCNVVFATSQHLREHELKIHTRHSIYICDICGNTFTSKACIGKHMKFVHMEREKLECDECGKKLPNKTTLIAHLGSHRLVKQLQCNLCQRRFNTISSLICHKKNHKKFYCKVCDSTFKFKIDLLSHVKIHPELACDKCHEFTDDMEKHKLMHKGGVPVKCHLCDKKMSRSNLGNHLKFHKGEKPHSCNVCKKSFTVRSCLKTHMLTHTGERNLSCDICDMTFIQAGQLQCHLRAHAGIKLFDCKRCGKKFSEKRGLQCHITIEHTKRKILICDICYKVYTNKEQLIKHIKSHKGKKHHFTCPVCKKRFQNLILLCHHAKMHKNDKWPCLMCDNVVRPQNMNRHYLLYHGVHAYACNICEEGTNDICALLSHMRFKHNMLSYRCQPCGTVYVEGKALLDHMRRVHDLIPKRPYIQYYSMSRR